MSESRDPRQDPALLAVKKVAEGGGEYGPFFDLGALAVVARVEADGFFATDPSLPC